MRRKAWDSSSPPSHLDAISSGLSQPDIISQPDIFFLALLPWAGEPGVGLGSFTLQGETTSAEISLWFLITALWIWDLPVPHFQSCLWLLLYITSYRTSAQLAFRGLSMMTIL